jgi:Flp pilus assembly protein TadB
MLVRTLQFFSIILIAIYVVPQAAHLIEYPGKMAMDRETYFAVQQIYAGWSLSAIPLFGAILATLALAFVSRAQRLPMMLSSLAFLSMALVLILFFMRVAPMNTVTEQWTTMPEAWEPIRAQWENGHALNAAITFAALVCATLSALIWTPERPVQTTS